MAAEIVNIRDDGVSADAVRVAADTLLRGGVVALPTETVYGVFARANEAGRDALYTLKERDRGKPLPYVVADPEDLVRFVEPVPAAARRLAQAFWPGPLTLVVGEGEGAAVRVPRQEFTRAVLRRVGVPVYGTSANPSGEAAACSVEELDPGLLDRLALVVDAGPARLREASTIVRIPMKGPLRMLRQGALPRGRLEEVLAMQVLIVCTGNTCRSPMAEALLVQLAKEEFGPELASRLHVVSAGLFAADGAAMSDNAQKALSELGIDGSAHRSRGLDDALLDGSDLLLGLTEGHRSALAEVAAEGQQVELLDPQGASISDPYGGPVEVYREARDQIRAALLSRLDELRGELENRPELA